MATTKTNKSVFIAMPKKVAVAIGQAFKATDDAHKNDYLKHARALVAQLDSGSSEPAQIKDWLARIEGIREGLGILKSYTIEKVIPADVYATLTKSDRTKPVGTLVYPWNSGSAYARVKAALKAIGFNAPKAKVVIDEATAKQKADKKAGEKRNAIKAIKAQSPKRKFQDGELEELVSEKIKLDRLAANDIGREITRLAAWCDKVSRLSIELGDIATADVRQVQLRMAAVIAEVKAITPSH